jgi:hypothetical protein
MTSYFADLAQSSIRGWQRFFFVAADPSPLGVIRIIVGALMVWNLATLGPDLIDYLGSDGWIGRDAVRHFLAENAPGAWSLWLAVPDSYLPVVWAACFLIATLFTLGFASRTTAVLTWAIAVSTARRAPVTLFGFDQINASWILYLAVTGVSGQAFSLDRLFACRRARKQTLAPSNQINGTSPTSRPSPTISANLALRLIQLHLVILYGSAGLSKLMGPEWWNGSALEKILLTPEFRRLDPTWFLAHPTVLQLATHLGLALEIAYPVLIWVRQLRPLLLVSVVLMHFGVDLMLGLTEFGLAMVAANLAFVTTWTTLERPTDSEEPTTAHVPRRRDRAFAGRGNH